jgi:DNA-directed RNA polymerase subunit omega
MAERQEVAADALREEPTPAVGAPEPEAAGHLGASGQQEWADEVESSSYLQSKYTLVSVAAKRARQLLEGRPPRVQTDARKPVSIALEELMQGKLYFERLGDRR